MSDALIESLAAAVDARPDDLPLRLHLAEMLLGAGRAGEAIGHAAQVLAREPANATAQRVMSSALAGPAAPAPGAPDNAAPQNSPTSTPAPAAPGGPAAPAAPGGPAAPAAPGGPAAPAAPGGPAASAAPGGPGASAAPGGPAASAAPGGLAASPAPGGPATPPAANDPATPTTPASPGDGVDWAALEGEFHGVVPPRFARADDQHEPVQGVEDRAFDVEKSTVTLADIGGMEEVKKRLELAFLAPLRNPELRTLFGKSLRGGLLLYGPPGCGKTFLARAVAGEMGAAFISLSIVDVLNMWIGSSERNLHDLFVSARAHAPCVLFLDEIDALGHKRSQLNSSAMRTVVNQLLTELDGVDGNNDGVFVLAATNAPWDIDAALRRPGRLDRTVLVLPPDQAARVAILRYHLREPPIANIDLAAIARVTEHHSGADLAHICETAAEFAMRDSITAGQVRMISQQDMLAAAREVRPSTDAWFATARNVAMFANESGEYDDLAKYLKKRKKL